MLCIEISLQFWTRCQGFGTERTKKGARDRTDIKFQASYLSSNIKNVQKLLNVSTEICCANIAAGSFSADKAKVLSLRQQTNRHSLNCKDAKAGAKYLDENLLHS